MKLQEFKDIITKLTNDASNMEPSDTLVPGLKSYLIGQEAAYRNVLAFLSLVNENEPKDFVKFRIVGTGKKLLLEQEMRCEALIDRVSCNHTAVWEVRVVDLTGGVVSYRVCNRCLEFLKREYEGIDFIPF